MGYLTAGPERAATLAGGEAQRIRLATQVGAGLKGVTLRAGRAVDRTCTRGTTRGCSTGVKAAAGCKGNTVLVVEHDDETMRESDFLVDVGPGAGREGGEIVASRRVPSDDVLRSVKESTDGAVPARRPNSIPVPEERREPKRR